MSMYNTPGVYFGFRHSKAVFGDESITEISWYETAIDPNHHNYLRAFKLKKDGTKYSKSIPIQSDTLKLFKNKLEALDYIGRRKRELEEKVQELVEHTKKNIEYLDGVQFP